MHRYIYLHDNTMMPKGGDEVMKIEIETQDNSVVITLTAKKGEDMKDFDREDWDYMLHDIPDFIIRQLRGV